MQVARPVVPWLPTMPAFTADRHVKALAEQRRRHGHLVLSTLEPFIPSELYAWAIKQRERWKAGRLERAIEHQLRAIGCPLDVEACEWEYAFFSLFGAARTTWRSPNLER